MQGAPSCVLALSSCACGGLHRIYFNSANGRSLLDAIAVNMTRCIHEYELFLSADTWRPLQIQPVLCAAASRQRVRQLRSAEHLAALGG